ncbi:MAG TPA: DegT/DnrJ/EryC1/StrS family aminotransferase [Terriglobales bacterium]|nr:DegT/DnrJ/EryC1/StrS family aminotransferase [Terriglobales bacterium]
MAAPIPQFSLERQHAALAPQLEAAAARVLASGRYVQDGEVAALEAELAAALGVSQVVACASGTDALHLALRAAGVGAGDAVLTSPFTFFGTIGAVLLAGAKVEFADIDPASFLLTPEGVAAALRRPRRERLAAILPVHLYGRMAEMPAICQLAAAAGVPVIEDAAQAIGARLPGAEGGRLVAAGAWGACGAISFYPTKNLGALGEAGCVVTGDARLANRLRELRSHGSPRRYEHERLGWNARMDELQAAWLRVKLPHLPRWTERRRALAARYEQLLAPLAGTVALPERTPDHVFHQYTIRTPRRDELRAHLERQGIGTEVYYPRAAHQQPALAGPWPPLPEAERAAREVLSLPLFPELEDAEVERVAAALRGFF